VLAGSSFSPAAAIGGIEVAKVTTNGDTTTKFPFQVSGLFSFYFELAGSEYPRFMSLGDSGDVKIIELVPEGWYISDISCEGQAKVGSEPSTFTFIPGEGVTITFVAPDYVVCTFTNSPITPAVGGVVIPANTLALVAPWLAVIGLVGCIATVAVIIRKRRP